MRSRFGRLIDTALVATVLALTGTGAAADGIRSGSWTFGYENVQLPGAERMGLANASYLVEATPGWWIGPALYGAASGQRGGLFTWGVEGQGRWRPFGGARLVAGVYVGGGGGASAPVGGGLMLRPHVDLLYDFGGFAIGVSASQVRFPNGDISSRQAGVVLSVDDVFEPAGGTLFKPARVALSVGRYQRMNRREEAAVAAGYVVARAEHRLGPLWSATLEAGAAASGSADGYAEFTAGVIGRWPVGPFDLGTHFALGLGGGGAVPTGGGPIAKAALLARWRLTDAVWIEAEAGGAGSLDGGWRTPYGGLTFGVECCRTPAPTEVAVAFQQYTGAQRRDGTTRSLGAIGLVARRAIAESVYVVGQAWGAVAGGAGAYSAGLVGVGGGWAWDGLSRSRAGIDALVGAAGGGGVSSAGGAVVQPMAWFDTAVGNSARLRLAVGVIKSVKGELSTPVGEVSLSFDLGRR